VAPRAGLAIAVTFPAALALYIHSRSFLPFFADDSFISLRYARRLLDGHGLTWTDGERVEGYTNLLWILSNAALGALGIDLVDAARGLGLACFVGGMAATSMAASTRPFGAASAGAAALLFALSGPVAAWTVGGLEQPLVVLLLLVALASVEWGFARREGPWSDRIAGVALALLCLTRPDSPLFVAGVFFGLCVAVGPRAAARRAGCLVALPAAAVIAQLAFRLGYYGDYVPNTARVKLQPNMDRFREGAAYLRAGLDAYWVVFAAALAASAAVLGFGRGARRRLGLVWFPMLLWAAYVVFIGGDIFPGRRHLVVLLALAYVAIARGLALAFAGGTLARSAACVALIVTMAGARASSDRDPRVIDARNERWEWSGAVSGTFFREAFGPLRPLMGVDAAGALPYFSGLPSIDMLGLNDRYLPLHPPEGFGHGGLAHELGDPAYIMSRRPDVIVPCMPLGSREVCHQVPWERRLFANRDFRRDYLPMTFRGDRPFVAQGTAWVRRDGKLGIRKSEDTIVLPASSLAAYGGVVVLDDERRPVLEVGPRTSARSPGLILPPGTWRFEVVAPHGSSLAVVPATVAGPTRRRLVIQNPSPRPEALARVVGRRVGGGAPAP
jgi:hypothetical protein